MKLGEEEYPVPVGYDGILKIAFKGDYMILPKDEDRVFKHKMLKGDSK